MGLTYVSGTVIGPAGKSENLEFLVDSGASYSLLPSGVWQRIGIEPQRAAEVTLADGSKISRRISECGPAIHPFSSANRATTTRCSARSLWKTWASSSIPSGANCAPCNIDWVDYGVSAGKHNETS